MGLGGSSCEPGLMGLSTDLAFHHSPSRIPIPHCGHHHTTHQNENEIGQRGQEHDLPLWAEDPTQEGQSIVSEQHWAGMARGAWGCLGCPGGVYPGALGMGRDARTSPLQLVQGPGAPGVLLPWLLGPGRGTAEHHCQRSQRRHLHVCGAPAPACAHYLLLARATEELSLLTADKALSL